MAGGFELLIVVNAKEKTVFEVGFDLIPNSEIQTIVCAGSAHTLLQAASCGGTKHQIPTTSGTVFSGFQIFRFAKTRSACPLCLQYRPNFAAQRLDAMCQ
jgi:hypothetical protein